MAVAVGFALVWLVVPPVGKRVFLRVVSTIATIMRRMTTAAATVKKAAFGRSKSPPLAVKKQLLIGRLSPALPRGLLFPFVHAHRPVSMSLSAGVDVAVGRRASLWGITALLTDWVTDMTHVMLFLAITCSTVGVAASLQTVIPTLAIIIAGSYHLIRGLVPYDT